MHFVTIPIRIFNDPFPGEVFFVAAMYAGNDRQPDDVLVSLNADLPAKGFIIFLQHGYLVFNKAGFQIGNTHWCNI